MRIPKRAALRLALAGWLGLAGLSLVAAQGRAATAPEKILPDSTIGFLKINNAAALRESFRQSQFGQLWNDPALKAWKADLADRIDDASKSLKDKVGVTYRELLELPQGTVSIAVVRRDDPKQPTALLITADAGKNASVMEDVMIKATKQAEQADSKVTTQTFRGAVLHVIQPPPDKDNDKPKAKDDKKDNDKPEPPLVWASQGTVYYIGSDVDAVKDLLAHESGRDDALAASESFLQAQKKLGTDVQVAWYVDLAKLLKLVAQSGATARGNAKGNADQTEAMIQVTGLNGLKAAAGSFTLNVAKFDSISKTFILAPAPAQGVLKIFQMPKVNLKPEPWVPTSVASYQTYSWDLDTAYTAINDLVNMFQPGMLNVLEQQLAGPNGGEPLSFQKDIFGPLGDRITVISDFKKPVTEESQRMLIGVALEDAKAFQNTLNKLIALGNGAPKKREFQGTTIYDFDVPDLPNANGANGPNNVRQFKGPISVAVAKDTLFIATEPTLLEQILRGGAALADSSSFQAVAREVPGPVSTLSYVRPDEQARIYYDMIKSGQFEKALQGAATAGGPDMAKLGKLIDKDKLPDFPVFAKYLSQGGSYGVMEDDGLTITGFTLRKVNP
ncbi:MAG TPA: hypothetical protein VKP69_26850 [Isosphaeraceae bacterium]|nr:hypothetical protein [Isosphaeraceae bacterium]